ncbi:MAG: fumarylacetoacetate hydrolase family protein [Verrucomicrobiota bacterium]
MAFLLENFTGGTRLTSIDSGEARTAAAFDLDALFQSDDPHQLAESHFSEAPTANADLGMQLAPIGSQPVWAAGVTYYRSRTARMEEAEVAGGDIFYDKVYDAERPELFFKSDPESVQGPDQPIGIRTDSTWDVPEPELTLAINAAGKVFGYTIGNDMSSRSIEGENPLYLPQAKCYRHSCGLGPALWIGPQPGPETKISINITRDNEVAFSGETSVAQIKRSFDELAGYLFRSNHFPKGSFLMTGTGIVPESDFTLQVDDQVAISIDGVGTLTNPIVEV